MQAAANGDQGFSGDQGIDGKQGLCGKQGFRAERGEQGYRGDQGIDGKQGVDGQQGSRGQQGLDGKQGHDGQQGFDGRQGYDGQQGVRGKQGFDGRQGFDGQQGRDGRQGYDGQQGRDGQQGFDGQQGVLGKQGLDGRQGFNGHQGRGGQQGFDGPQGLNGSQGYRGGQGLSGLMGDQGEDGPQGIMGCQGRKGDQGYRGQQGFRGEQGEVGFKGMQAAANGDQGFSGDQGIDGKQGLCGKQGFRAERGEQGYRGGQGVDGQQGFDGRQGYRGMQGFDGKQGVDGQQGYRGQQGFDGKQGVYGQQGFRGTQGPSGNDTDDDCFCLDFETDANGNIMAKQRTANLTDVGFFHPNLTLSLHNATAGDLLMIFDSSNPGPEDFDLGTPHTDFGGPGIGSAGAAGQPGQNDTPLSKLLIISEGGTAHDDAAAGGTIRFTWAQPVYVGLVTTIDCEEAVSFNAYKDTARTILASSTIGPMYGNNAVCRANVNTAGVRVLDVVLNGSGAIAELCWWNCPIAQGQSHCLQAVTKTDVVSTNSTSYVDISKMSMTTSQPTDTILVSFTASVEVSGSIGDVYFQIEIDGVSKHVAMIHIGETNKPCIVGISRGFSTANDNGGLANVIHLVKIRWKTNSSGVTARMMTGTDRSLTVTEFSSCQQMSCLAGIIDDGVNPLDDATVTADNGLTTHSILTSGMGHYNLPVPPGTYSVTVSKTGYSSSNNPSVSVSRYKCKTYNATLTAL